MATCGDTLAGTVVYLRQLREDDASDAYAGWLNDPVVNMYLETRSVTVPELKKYIKEKIESPSALLFGIFATENGQHIGNLKFEPIDHDAQETTMGILIGDKNYWGKGAGTDATNVATRFAFNTLGMKAVNLGVISKNAPAIRVYEKCGFTLVRTEKNALNHDGVLYDRLVYRKERP